MNTVMTVVRKELRDSLRDRRSMTAALLFAIFGPMLIAVMITITAERETSDEPFEVSVQGMEHAEDLTGYLLRNQVEIDDDAAVKLRIPEDYAERFEEGRIISVEVLADRSKSKPRRDADRLESLIDEYAQSLGRLRLTLRGVSASVVRPIIVDKKDLASAEARASLILGILVIYFLLAAFIGSLAVSIDMSAGERERNSLEVLMAQPVSPVAIFSGKWLVASLFGAVAIGMTVIFSKLAFLKVPLTKIGLTWTMSWLDAAEILLSLLPLAAMVAALQIVVAMLAKSYKEASSYLNMLSFLPAVVAFVVLVQEVDPETWHYAVPLLGHQQMLRTMIRGESLEWVAMGLLMVSTLAVTAALIAWGGRMLRQERIIFGQSD